MALWPLVSSLCFLSCCCVRGCWFGIDLFNHTQQAAILVHPRIRCAAVWVCLFLEKGKEWKCYAPYGDIIKSFSLCAHVQTSKSAAQQLLCCDLQEAATSAFSMWFGEPDLGTRWVRSSQDQGLLLDRGKQWAGSWIPHHRSWDKAWNPCPVVHIKGLVRAEEP